MKYCKHKYIKSIFDGINSYALDISENKVSILRRLQNGIEWESIASFNTPFCPICGKGFYSKEKQKTDTKDKKGRDIYNNDIIYYDGLFGMVFLSKGIFWVSFIRCRDGFMDMPKIELYKIHKECLIKGTEDDLINLTF